MANLLSTIGDPHAYNYSLETVPTHNEAQLPRRIALCLADSNETRAKSTKCQPEQNIVSDGAAWENLQERENTRVSVSSLSVYRSVYTDCKSLHSMAELLRYIVFILIPAGIVQVRRCTQKEIVRPTLTLVKCLLSILVFTINLPAALVIFCYAFVPIFGIFLFFHFTVEANTLWKMIIFDVIFLAPFFTIGSLTFTEILRLPLSSTSIVVFCFILPLAYCIGWVTIVHYLVNKKLECKYGIWSLPGYFWSIDLRLGRYFMVFFFPAIIIHMYVLSWWSVLSGLPVPLIHVHVVLYITKFKCDNDTVHNKHILACEAIVIAGIFLYSGFSAHYVVPACVVGCLYFALLGHIDYPDETSRQDCTDER